MAARLPAPAVYRAWLATFLPSTSHQLHKVGGCIATCLFLEDVLAQPHNFMAVFGHPLSCDGALEDGL